MYASLALGVVVTGLNDAEQIAKWGAASVLTIQTLTFGFLILMIWLIAPRRKNWARWVLAIMVVLGTPFAIVNLTTMYKAHPLAGLLSGVQMVLQLVAVYMIFTGNASDWFRPPNRSLPPESAASA